MSVVVVGAGNRFRSDDGVGPRVLDRLADLAGRGVTLVESDGSTASLLDAWEGADSALVVEAARSGHHPGTIIGLSAEEVLSRVRATASGSHDLGVAGAIALGKELGRLPQHLRILGIEPAELGFGDELSAAVSAKFDDLVSFVRSEIERSLKPDAR